MNELVGLQTKLQHYLMHAEQDIVEHVLSTSKVPAETRLAIYGEAYRSRLIEALATSYPALKRYLGGDLFDELCFSYIDKHPSEFLVRRGGLGY